MVSPSFFLGGLSHRDLTIPSDPQIDGYSVVNIDVQTAQFVHHIIEKNPLISNFSDDQQRELNMEVT